MQSPRNRGATIPAWPLVGDRERRASLRSRAAPFVALLLAVFIGPVRAQAPAGATLVGCVMFVSGGALPSVPITVAGGTVARTVMTNDAGCYEAGGLPPARFERLDFAMHLGGICESLMMTLADLWNAADVVVHVRFDAHEPDDTIVSSYPPLRHATTVLTTFKEPANGVPRALTFIQFQKKWWAGREFVEPVYENGQEAVLFLNWNPALGVYVRAETGNFTPAAFTVSAGRVQIDGLDPPGVPFEVPIQELRERAARP